MKIKAVKVEIPVQPIADALFNSGPSQEQPSEGPGRDVPAEEQAGLDAANKQLDVVAEEERRKHRGY